MRRGFNPDSEQLPAVVGTDHSLLCRFPDCGRRWTVDMSHGKVCSYHDEWCSRQPNKRLEALATRRPSMPASIPTLGEAVKPFCEVDDEEDF